MQSPDSRNMIHNECCCCSVSAGFLNTLLVANIMLKGDNVSVLCLCPVAQIKYDPKMKGTQPPSCRSTTEPHIYISDKKAENCPSGSSEEFVQHNPSVLWTDVCTGGLNVQYLHHYSLDFLQWKFVLLSEPTANNNLEEVIRLFTEDYVRELEETGGSLTAQCGQGGGWVDACGFNRDDLDSSSDQVCSRRGHNTYWNLNKLMTGVLVSLIWTGNTGLP